MNIAVLERPVEQLTGDGDDLTHFVCDCRPHLAACGAFVGEHPWADEDAPCTPCEPCIEFLEAHGCPYCGCQGHRQCDQCRANPDIRDR